MTGSNGNSQNMYRLILGRVAKGNLIIYATTAETQRVWVIYYSSKWLKL
jgi:hypothetical protein